MLEELSVDDPHWDEIVVVGPASPEERDQYDEVPAAPEEDLTEYLEPDDPKKSVISRYDAPDPLALLAKRAADEKAKETALEKQFPFMKAAMAFMARQQVRQAVPQLELDDEILELDEDEAPALTASEEAWFSAQPVVEKKPTTAVKTSWLSRLSTKIGDVVEGFGKFLDYAVPTATAAAVAATIGLGANTVTKQENTVLVAQAPKITVQASTVQMQAPKPEEFAVLKPAAKTLAETQTNAASLNDLLVKKNQEIVHAAGGTKAKYLHSPAAYAQLNATLTKATGFGAILNHPEVKKAKNIAEMVNLVDQYFGEEMADLIESNAASMHLSVSDIATLR